MFKIFTSKVLFFCIFSVLFFSCEKKQQFTVNGEIQGENGKMLYLENIGISKITILDSVKLDKNSFTFKQNRPQAPDFYRLRLGNQIINFAIDSTETITITASDTNFATDYSLSGDDSESKKIKELSLLQLNTSQKYNSLQKQYEANEITIDQYAKSVEEIVDNYKTTAKSYIASDFLSTSTYFALFQQVNNLLIFDIYNKEDNRLFGAVANAWNTAYPDSPRALQLKNLFTNSIAVLRGERPIEIEASEADSKDFFDISLPALDGKEIRLSEAGKNKVTLVEFTAYTKNDSPIHNMLLAEIYTKYQPKGFEIYQISLDPDEHFWKNVAVNLPWICVRDPESVYSSASQKYNVTEIPATFILDKDGEIVLRVKDYNTIERELAKYLQ